ncbi:MAG: sorbosone dehydrogenase family protein [Acidobacteriota bacterium]|nr:sorbosone dehydrogenase family protein [Acidobacteriota bacterium]
MSRLLLPAALVCFLAPIHAGQQTPPAQAQTPPRPPQPARPALDLASIKLPAGFSIAVYAEGLPNARQMAVGSAGTVFVGSRTPGTVYAVVDADKDHKADRVVTIATGLRQPSGLAFRNGSLYVAEINRIIRFDDIEKRLDAPPAPVVVSDTLPTEAHHGWKFLAFGPDGYLYVPVGAPCNVCERTDDERFATILRMRPDGTGLEVYARGVRNTVGFDFHPQTRELWFSDNGRDGLGDDVPPDELNRVERAGQHFGFPYCHGGTVADPEHGAKRPCADFIAPARTLGAHVAAIGMRFYSGSMFPAEYKNAIFVAEHGSWNRTTPQGYRVMVAKLKGNDVVSYEPFAEGWLQGANVRRPDNVVGVTSARPADVHVMPDGSLLISDDHAGRIFRVSYKRP